MNMLRKMLDHLRWADGRILEALQRAPTPPPRALEIYGHVLGAEHTWLARISGRDPEVAVWPETRVEDCARLAATNAGALAALLDSATNESLQRSVHYRNSAGAQFESRVDDILMHVAMHGQYHRGQVNLLLREAGLQPTPVDYIAFIRETPAATRRP